jgi:DNA-binding XRE family transcriptional regulator
MMKQATINAIAEIIGVTPESIIEIEPRVNEDVYEVRSRDSENLRAVDGITLCRHIARAS